MPDDALIELEATVPVPLSVDLRCGRITDFSEIGLLQNLLNCGQQFSGFQ